MNVSPDLETLANFETKSAAIPRAESWRPLDSRRWACVASIASLGNVGKEKVNPVVQAGDESHATKTGQSTSYPLMIADLREKR